MKTRGLLRRCTLNDSESYSQQSATVKQESVYSYATRQTQLVPMMLLYSEVWSGVPRTEPKMCMNLSSCRLYLVDKQGVRRSSNTEYPKLITLDYDTLQILFWILPNRAGVWSSQSPRFNQCLHRLICQSQSSLLLALLQQRTTKYEIKFSASVFNVIFAIDLCDISSS